MNSQVSECIYDAVVTVGPKHTSLASLTVHSLIEYSNVRIIYLVGSEKILGELSKSIQDNQHIKFLDEADLIPSMTLDSLKAYIKTRGGDAKRAGLYFQQFLKMAICQLPDVADYYLIWDADAIMLRPISFFGKNGSVLMSSSGEYHAPYFLTYEAILGRKRSVDFSFICEHMMVKVEYMRELLTVIERSAGESKWAWNIMDAIRSEHLSYAGFSEFETYGNFVTSLHPEAIEHRSLPYSRQVTKQFGRSPNKYDLYRLSLTYSYVCFEAWRYIFLRVWFEKIYSFVIYYTRKQH